MREQAGSQLATNEYGHPNITPHHNTNEYGETREDIITSLKLNTIVTKTCYKPPSVINQMSVINRWIMLVIMW